jgi:hypothetical protein
MHSNFLCNSTFSDTSSTYNLTKCVSWFQYFFWKERL